MRSGLCDWRAAAGAALWLGLLAGVASGDVLKVGGTDGFAAIGPALAAARPGDTILVAPGEYRGRVVIDMPVQLVGVGRPLLSLFLLSAVADAMSLAERSFPLVPSSNERDGMPRMKPVSGVRLSFHPPGSSGSWLPALGALLAFSLSAGLAWRLRQ